MFSTLLTIVAAKDEFVLEQVITEGTVPVSLFGRSVAYQSREKDSSRIVVGCPYEPDGDVTQRGAVHIYDYNIAKGKYVHYKKLNGATAKVYKNEAWPVQVGGLGSTVAISEDGSRIIAGAPYTTITLDPDNPFTEVGAILIFEEKNGVWTETLLAPNEEDLRVDEGLGRSMAINDDGTVIAAAYYNKRSVYQGRLAGDVFITSLTLDGSWKELQCLTPPDLTFGSDVARKWGSSLAFSTSTELLVAIEITHNSREGMHGTVIYSLQNDEWVMTDEIKGVIPPEGAVYTLFGSPISLSPNNDQLISVVTNDKVSSMLVVKKIDNKWQDVSSEEIKMPDGYSLGNVESEFCGQYLLATDIGHSYTLKNGTEVSHSGAGVIFKLDNNMKYQVYQYVYPPEEDVEKIWSILMGSGIAWSPNCDAFVLGAMNKDTSSGFAPALDNPRAYVFRLKKDSSSGLSDGELIAIIVSVVGVVVIAVVVVALVLFFRRKKADDVVA